MSRLLVEIGVEELPSRDVAPAAAALGREVARVVREGGLGGGEAKTFATPRRLAVLVDAVAAVEGVREREVRGPSRDRAYGPDGAPTAALLGFCRGQKIGPDEVRVVETPAGAYVMATVREGGRAAAEVLAAALPTVIAALPFSRSMRWGDGLVRFGRPLAWLVAMLDERVIDFEFAGVRAGRESRGHRFLAPGPVPLGAAADYEARLEAAFVLAARDRRRARVEAEVAAAAAAENLRAEMPAALLDEISDLVEWPTAFVGRFPERFLSLPDAALTTPIVHHQREVPTRDGGGRRANAFVGVRNGGDRGMALVRRGNEAVLAARLADALFFYERDLAVPLETMRASLGGLELGDGLGSLLDRAERVEQLVGVLAEPADAATAARVAHLLLVDRSSRMVGEFPELAGVMGAVYAAAAGEPEAVSEGLRQAARPRDGDDGLPEPGPGRLAAIALRAEELVGGFAAGRAPTGSEDPYALRRSALALARLGLAGGIPGGTSALLARAAATLTAFSEAVRTRAAAMAADFLRERVEGILIEQGRAQPVAQAVVAGSLDRLETVEERARALEAFLAGGEADGLITAYRRAARMVERAAAEGAVAAADWRTWQPPTEADRTLVEAVAAALAAEEAGAAGHFARVAALTGPLDRFFREVMVLDPDPSVRAHRLATLRAVVGLASAHADLSRIGRQREESAGA